MQQSVIHKLLIRLVIFLAIGAIPVRASIRPSFHLDWCSWNATHIVLVRTTSKDGVFSVTKSWKGDLKPGDSLAVPELKPDKDAVAISSYPKPEGFDVDDAQAVAQQIPRQPVGAEMILFLRKKDTASSPATEATGTRWQPASSFGGMKVSAVWIDHGSAFCFLQWMNPGPSALYKCLDFSVGSSDVAVLTARIQHVLQVQGALAMTIAIKNHPEARADRIGHIAQGDVWVAQGEALDALGKSGAVALPEILQAMDKPTVPYDSAVTIRALVEAAGNDSGRVLNGRLQQDLIYWRTIAPTLTLGWRGRLTDPGGPLWVKFDETEALIRELDEERYAPAAQTAAELRDFWVSQPVLNDPSGGQPDGNSGTAPEAAPTHFLGLAKDCDDFVKHMASGKARQ